MELLQMSKNAKYYTNINNIPLKPKRFINWYFVRMVKWSGPTCPKNFKVNDGFDIFWWIYSFNFYWKTVIQIIYVFVSDLVRLGETIVKIWIK